MQNQRNDSNYRQNYPINKRNNGDYESEYERIQR